VRLIGIGSMRIPASTPVWIFPKAQRIETTFRTGECHERGATTPDHGATEFFRVVSKNVETRGSGSAFGVVGWRMVAILRERAARDPFGKAAQHARCARTWDVPERGLVVNWFS
jgi:hypothetical protein